MGESIKYIEYEKMYPETVIIRKEGYIYVVRGQSAIVAHAFFQYKGWKNDDDVISIGFSEHSLGEVCNTLQQEKISYVVIVKGEIITGKNFDNQNRFNVYLATDVSDIPYKEKKASNKVLSSGSILSTDEEKLCEISVTYLNRLLSGHHPVNNSVIEGDSVLLDENVQKCFRFVVDVLKRVNTSTLENISKDAELKSKRLECSSTKNISFTDDFEDVISGMLQDNDISISELESVIRKNLSHLFVEKIDKVPAIRISNWLRDNGYLATIDDGSGNHHREATEDGKIIGMVNNIVDNGEAGTYVQYRFKTKAQRFVYENLDVIALYVSKKTVK